MSLEPLGTLKATRPGPLLPLPGEGGRGSEQDNIASVIQPAGFYHVGLGWPGAPGSPGELWLAVQG